jgi:hypothetical protein
LSYRLFSSQSLFSIGATVAMPTPFVSFVWFNISSSHAFIFKMVVTC